MIVNAIIQARLSSSRLPGKMLRDIAGKPAIQYILERLAHCSGIDNIVVATSAEPSDDPLADYCQARGVLLHRGPLYDVAGRFVQALERFPCTAFARVCGDRVFYDQQWVDHGIRLFADADYDLVTNVFPRTFPVGQTVEIVSSETYRKAYSRFTEPEDREHVTRFLYNHAPVYRILNFTANEDRSAVHLAIDHEADMMLFSDMIEHMTRPHWTYGLEEVIEILGAAAVAESLS